MGLSKNLIALMISAKLKREVSLESTLMIGRQNLFTTKAELSSLFNYFNLHPEDFDNIIAGERPFADKLINLLGATTVQSVDASDYEDSTFIHDFNYPLNGKIKHTYNLVLDSGTLEHIFNVPQALKNSTELVANNGHYMGFFPCNNFFGHGFYQFSSELFYRTFTEENGFRIIDVIIFIDEPNAEFYSVPDTNENLQRVQFTNTKPVYIYVLAKRVNSNELFKTYPLQNDYSNFKWKGVRTKKKSIKKTFRIKNVIPIYFRNLVKVLLNKPLRSESYNFKKPYFKKYSL